jgi:tetratricopeptide (TPR) repeat protein
MAWKLSRIATNGLISIATLAATAYGAAALGQSRVQVAPANKIVENPFSVRRNSQTSPTQAPLRSVPREESNEPKSYQNPFAVRPAAPPMLTPMPTRGSLSRWRQTVELPEIKAAARGEAPEPERWDMLNPDALDSRRPSPLVGSEPASQPQLDLPQRSSAFQEAPQAGFEPPMPGAQTATSSPPDPIRFAPSALHQPYWLLPDPSTGEVAASEPSNAAAAEEAAPTAAYPITVESFGEPGGEAAVVSDESSRPTHATQQPAAPKTPSECYAQAEQAAANAATVDELGTVVRLCRQGLAGRPQGELAKSLRTMAAWASNRRGEIKSDDRREDEALREFEIAIQFDPSCWLALHNRGVSRAQQGLGDEALDDFNRTIELNPGHIVAYRNRGELLAAMGRTDEAAADYTRALAQLPDDPNLLLMRGHALHRLGRYQESFHDLNRAIELAPQSAEALAHRGNVLAERGDFARAIRDFQQSIRLDSESPDAYRSLAWLLATCPDPRFRNPQQALAAAQRAESLATPGDCFVLEALAAAHANAGQYDQAVRYQREAVSIAPGDFRSTFAGRLALYEQRQPFRNGGDRAATRDVRAASLETSARQQ